MAKSLIIVESPAKARTLQRYLGNSYEVKASVGHIRDLPVKTLGVDTEHDFKPQYVTIRGKSKIIEELKRSAKKADRIFLAPDPDREGEAIAFHIAECLKNANKPFHRALFHELTKKAILVALENAQDLNVPLFEAQQARRILDRLVGYQISPLLWDKVKRGLSAGRVQSVAVRMVCDRENEIAVFQTDEYWSIGAQLKGPVPPSFIAYLDQDKEIKKRISTESQANEVAQDIRKSSFTVAKIEKKKKNRNPSPPFITSSLQIEANRKLRFSAKKTMTLAQRLYEGVELGQEGPTGLITYMRTDSTRINDEALVAVRAFITETYSKEYLPPKPIIYKTKKSAQDAHEAIRPTDVSRTPEKMAHLLDKDTLALYSLIWKRFVACQMAPALFDQTTFKITAGKYNLRVTGSVIRFQGFLALYEEAQAEAIARSDAPDESREKVLPDLKEGDRCELLDVLPKQHFTQPPPRYSEATLVKALEENGVGRPSTYASILSTIQDKEYVLLSQRQFRPTDLGKLVNDLLVKHFPLVMSVDFTAGMEKNLDKVEEGEIHWLQILKEFYTPFKETLDKAKEEMKSVKRSSVPTDINCTLCEGKMAIKWGRNGEFLACENFPECKSTLDFTRSDEGAVVPVEREAAEQSDEICEKCGNPMVYKNGRFGKFLACSGYPKCKNVRSQGVGVKCPEQDCDGEIVQKISKRGKVFYSCNRYPKCTFALWDKPVNKNCPSCGALFLLEKESKKQGPHLKCATKDCDYSETLSEEAPDTP
ncbi:MAG: type I DNA topoisomerase [Proteobacteria bacterium]|nr:type I DNA topoisomerase [Pseudomonadota bacterium]MBU1709101.1 type I DNA topoisomerase [Pseudomonadota bacterium]